MDPAGDSGNRRYRIEGIIGRGAFGTVYLADYLGEEGFTRQVALKILNPDRENLEDIAQRLRDEARLLGLLRHRAIVHVDGLVFLNGRWTVVMEYIGGVDLQRLLTQGSMPVGPALEVVGEVAGALNVAYYTKHKDDEPLRLLHRDIKPSNILLTPAGEVKVVDFGVARAQFETRESDTSGTRFGSLGYMAPERLEFIDGPEGDVYALGAVLFELLAGRPLGRTSVHPARHAKHVQEAMQLLHREKPQLPTNLKGFLSTMLDYEASRRPSAREVETQCHEVRGGLSEIWLREWAEASVPPFVRVGRPDPDESGRILSESRSGDHPDPRSNYEEPTRADLLSRGTPASATRDVAARGLDDVRTRETPDHEAFPSRVHARLPKLSSPGAIARRFSPAQPTDPDPWKRYWPIIVGISVLLALPVVGYLVVLILWIAV